MVQIVTTVDDTEFWSMVFGSAFETWEWWTGVAYVEGDWNVPGVVNLSIMDPMGDEDKDVTKTLTLADVAAAYGKYQSENPGATSWDDLDACSSDAILQIAVLGEIVYA